MKIYYSTYNLYNQGIHSFFLLFQYSVDCTHANTGLFTGIFVMVVTIISLIVFFVLISSPDPKMHAVAIQVASITELSLYCLTIVAVLVGMCQVGDCSVKLK